MIQKMGCYRHIEEKDRRRIAKLKSYRLSVSEIARRTGFNKSTIGRELKRNGCRVKYDLADDLAMFESLEYSEVVRVLKDRPLEVNYWSYSRSGAEYAAKWRKRRANSRCRVSLATQTMITEHLKSGWSPQQIAGRSKTHWPESISHEYVYQFIVKDRKKGGKLYRLLKRFGKRKQRLGRRDYVQNTIPDRVPIHQRPEAANLRHRIGDLEGDLIVGRKQSGYILSVIDRKTRLLALELMKNRKQKEVTKAFLRAFKRMREIKTLTLDNAREFNCHRHLTAETGIQVYFADPYSSHQRGSIENANGLVRYYLPKKTDFSQVTVNQLRKIEDQINSRPKKILGYLTPSEANAI